MIGSLLSHSNKTKGTRDVVRSLLSKSSTRHAWDSATAECVARRLFWNWKHTLCITALLQIEPVSATYSQALQQTSVASNAVKRFFKNAQTQSSSSSKKHKLPQTQSGSSSKQKNVEPSSLVKLYRRKNTQRNQCPSFWNPYTFDAPLL